jgi:hypothetical protein
VASFSRRPMGRRQRPGPQPRPAPEYGADPLYGVFRDGRRIYLPAERPGVPLERAKQMAASLGCGVEIREVYGGGQG